MWNQLKPMSTRPLRAQPEGDRRWDSQDEDEAQWAFEWLCGDLLIRAREAFPSFDPQQGWRGREDRILLRNAYADFGVSTYGSLAAVRIAEREDGSYREEDMRTGRHARAEHWLHQIAPKFDALFGDYDCLGHFSNGKGVCRKHA